MEKHSTEKAWKCIWYLSPLNILGLFSGCLIPLIPDLSSSKFLRNKQQEKCLKKVFCVFCSPTWMFELRGAECWMCRVWKTTCAHWKSDLKMWASQHDLWHHKQFVSQSWCSMCDVSNLSLSTHWEWTSHWSTRKINWWNKKFYSIFIYSRIFNGGEGTGF